MIKTIKNSVKKTLRPAYHTLKRLVKKPGNDAPASKLIFFFGGREVAWPGVGRELYINELVFKNTIKQCNTIIVDIGGPNILPYFEGPVIENYFDLDANFICACAIQIATAKTMFSKGIYPDAILGVSMGEIAAMYIAGANSLEDTLKICLNWLTIADTEKKDYYIIIVNQGIEDARVFLKNHNYNNVNPIFEVNEKHTLLTVPITVFDSLDTFLKSKDVAVKKFARPFLSYHTPIMDKYRLKHIHDDKKSLSQLLLCDYYSPSVPAVLKKHTFVNTNYWHRALSSSVLLNTMLKVVANDSSNAILQIGPAGIIDWNSTGHKIEIITTYKRDIDEIQNFRSVIKTLLERKLTNNEFTRTDELNKLAAFKNNFDPFVLNPPAAFEYLREHGNLHEFAKKNVWLVLGYDLAESVLKQPHIFSNDQFKVIDPTLLGAEPEPHKIIRDLIQPLFSLDAIKNIAANCENKAHEVIDSLLQQNEFDFLTDFSSPLLLSVLFDFWGYTEIDSAHMISITGNNPYSPDYIPNLFDYFTQQLKLSQQQLGNTLTEKLRSFIDDGHITFKDGVSLARILWLGGIHTTITFNTSVFNKLMEEDDIALKLKADTKLIPIFISECLRLMPPVNFLIRITTEPVELDGSMIPANAYVLLHIESANTDPQYFTKADKILFDRPAKRNFSFGAGMHQCIGIGIARAQSIALTTVILSRWDDFKQYTTSAPHYHQFGESKIITSLKLKKINSN